MIDHVHATVLVGNQWRRDASAALIHLSATQASWKLCVEQKWKAVLRALTAHWRIRVAAAAAGFGLRTRTLMDALVCVYVCFLFILFFSPKSLFTSKRDGWSQPAEHLSEAKNKWVEALRPCSRALPRKKKNRQKNNLSPNWEDVESVWTGLKKKQPEASLSCSWLWFSPDF